MQWLIYWLLYSLIQLTEALLWPVLVWYAPLPLFLSPLLPYARQRSDTRRACQTSAYRHEHTSSMPVNRGNDRTELGLVQSYFSHRLTRVYSCALAGSGFGDNCSVNQLIYAYVAGAQVGQRILPPQDWSASVADVASDQGTP